MQFTQRQRLLRLDWRPFVATIAVGLALGFAGPFGSYPAFPTATRYAFWLGLSVVGALAVLAADAVLPVTRLRAGAIRIGAVALLSALPMTFVVAWTMSFLQPGRIYAPQQLAGLFWGVAAVQLLVAYVMNSAQPAVEGGGCARSCVEPPGTSGRDGGSPLFRPPWSTNCRLRSAATSSRSRRRIIIFACMRPGEARSS